MSLYSSSHNFIYVSGGRCATTSIHSSLRSLKEVSVDDPAMMAGEFNKYDKHMPAVFMKKFLGDDIWNKCFVFSFVRNPFSWVVSCHFNLHCEQKLMEISDFEEIVRHCRSKEVLRGMTHTDIRTQYDFLSDGNSIVVPNIGRFENLQQDFDGFCEKCGLSKMLIPKLHCSVLGSEKWRDHYANAKGARSLVEKCWKKDIDAFGYTFQ